MRTLALVELDYGIVIDQRGDTAIGCCDVFCNNITVLEKFMDYIDTQGIETMTIDRVLAKTTGKRCEYRIRVSYKDTGVMLFPDELQMCIDTFNTQNELIEDMKRDGL